MVACPKRNLLGKGKFATQKKISNEIVKAFGTELNEASVELFEEPRAGQVGNGLKTPFTQGQNFGINYK